VELFHQKNSISKRTETILKKLSERGHSKIVNGVSVRILSALKKGEVKVKDLGRLQAATKHEYTLLRGIGKYGERVLIRGTPNQVGLPAEYLEKKYVWSGHSHPDDTSPSQADRDALSAFDQECSVIVSVYESSDDPKYKTRTFEQIEDWSDWLPS
jgi:proteasome lid subunit RPN8/RPN11